ncbi:MAG TPA: class I SAM-dependent methyltransferase [Ignavibacteriaceae bacterium]|nr:class I SAM-dependent methyltransferase [Ignavibacteriaceae bacterium]
MKNINNSLKNVNILNRKTWENRLSVLTFVNQNNLQKAEIEIFEKYKQKISGKSVLDIGCGTGRTTRFLATHTSNIIGIDYSERMISAASKLNPNIDYRVCDVRDLNSLSQHQFDFILYSFNGLDYLDHMDRIRALKNIHKVLKNDGVFVFSSHNINNFNHSLSPRLKFELNIYKQFKNIVKFCIEVFYYLRFHKKKIVTDDYSIFNDDGNFFSLLTYYISKEKAADQLKNCGFDILEIFDQYGNNLSQIFNDEYSNWIYYVAKKNN